MKIDLWQQQKCWSKLLITAETTIKYLTSQSTSFLFTSLPSVFLRSRETSRVFSLETKPHEDPAQIQPLEENHQIVGHRLVKLGKKFQHLFLPPEMDFSLLFKHCKSWALGNKRSKV